MKIGILSARSKVYPTIARDFFSGLKTYLHKQDLYEHFEFLNESIGFGGSQKEVYEKAEHLLIMEQVDLLVAYIDERVLEILKPLLYSNGKLVIVINPGANYPVNWVPQPNIIHLTLQHTFCCWLTGALAKNETKSNAATCSTFYDCGYLHAASMVKSFVRRGGEIKFNYINNQAYDDAFHINELTDFLSAQHDTRNMLCQFDTLPASLFYKLLNLYKDRNDLQVYASPMMLEQTALHAQIENNFSIEGYVAWLAQLDNPVNIQFLNSMKEEKKNAANMFSLLGWETGMILEEVITNNKDHYEDGEALATSLKKIKLNSPRGDLQLDDATQFYISQLYKCSYISDTIKVETEAIENVEKEWQLFTNEKTEGPVAGWTNTYLCY